MDDGGGGGGDNDGGDNGFAGTLGRQTRKKRTKGGREVWRNSDQAHSTTHSDL